MLPRVVLYNSVSVDGAIKDFDIDMELHYGVAGKIGAKAMLIGSDTAKSGLEMFIKVIPKELAQDTLKPVINEDNYRAFWIIADSHGKLSGLLHMYRRSEFVKDVIVLVSHVTPTGYLDYLKQRNYDYIVAGSDHIDYKAALEELNKRYGFETIITDTGGILSSFLFEQELINELQLLVAPEIVGAKGVNLFRSLKKHLQLKLIQTSGIKGHVLLKYKVEYS